MFTFDGARACFITAGDASKHRPIELLGLTLALALPNFGLAPIGRLNLSSRTVTVRKVI
jgi:hypothetical protein